MTAVRRLIHSVMAASILVLPDQPATAAAPSGSRILIVDGADPAAADDLALQKEGVPFKTIGAAAAEVRPGETILVKGGVYREHVLLTRSGAPGQRITLRAAPGERVVISGAEPITGWRKCSPEELRGNPDWDKVFCADLDWAPVKIFFDGAPEGIRYSRFPKGDETRPHRDSVIIESGDTTRIVDSKNLRQEKGFWEGGTLGVWRQANDSVAAGRIVAYNPERHELAVDRPRPHAPVPGRDRYFVYNLPGLISEPGEYAIDTTKRPHRLYFWPPRAGDPNQMNIEGSRRPSAITGRVSHVTVEGFEATRTYATGIGFGSGEENEIVRCTAYYCLRGPRMRAAFGFGLKSQRGSSIRNSISVLNTYGMGISEATNCVIEANLSGRHIVDAIVLSWHSRNIRVARNYVFDNWDTGHPDGFQTYRDVQGLVLDGNLFLNVGQGWQCQETQDSIVTNNIWAGIHWPNSISCSLRPAVVGEQNLRNTFINNTFFGGSISTGGESRFLNNIVIPPAFGGTSGGPPIETDYNLVWAYPSHRFRYSGSGQRRNQTTDFRIWQRATGSNPNSKFANPGFRSAPLFTRSLASGGDGNLARVQLARGNVEGFSRGDYVEIDCDGIRRRVTAVGSGFILVDPPLPGPHREGLSFAWNWKANSALGLDMRLAEHSPGRMMGKGGVDVGSNIDIQGYMRGDLTGDGARDVPLLPEELRRRPDLQKSLR
jgi:hypothetical protein